MRVTTASPGRRLLVQPVEGASIRESIREAMRGDDVARAQLRVHGRIDGVRLVREATARAGVHDVISLTGLVTGDDAELVLMATAADGTIVAGPLLDARVVQLDIHLDEELLPDADAPPPPTKKLPSAVSLTWADVARASAAAEAAEPPLEDNPPPQPGDRIVHPSFGDCAVEKLEEDEDFVLVRNPQGRLMRLSLEVLRLELVGEEEGRRRFRVPTRAARPR